MALVLPLVAALVPVLYGADPRTVVRRPSGVEGVADERGQLDFLRVARTVGKPQPRLRADKGWLSSHGVWRLRLGRVVFCQR